MAIERVNPDSLGNIHSRPAPRCYSRPRMSTAVSESRIHAERNVVLMGLSVVMSVVTCVTFVLVSGAWSF
jgi:hypothetical protein